MFAVNPALCTSGQAILHVGQIAKLAVGVADRADVLETGPVTREGSVDVLLNDPNVNAAYLDTH